MDIPAFPIAPTDSHHGWNGMTLRDYFAAAALQGWLASEGDIPLDAEKVTAAECYRYADAMIAERNNRND